MRDLQPARRLALCVLCLCSTLLATTIYAAAPMHDHELPLAFVELTRELNGRDATVRLRVDWQALDDAGHDGLEEVVLETLQRGYFAEFPAQTRSVLLLAEVDADRHPWVKKAGHHVGQWRPLVEFMRPISPPPKRSYEAPDDESLPPPPPPGPSTLAGTPHIGLKAGGLAGKTVYLSPGHGWTWHPGMKRWYTQRGNTHDIVEDFVNAEGALHYLVPLLHNAGATVVPVREHDMQDKVAIVDDAEGSAGGYVEAGTWQKGAEKGFADGKAPYLNGVNPFTTGGYRAAKASAKKSTATATFTATFPKAGRYGVHIGYVAGNNRVADAHFEIRHAGGVTHRYIDMRKHGRTWHWLGDFWFDQGKSSSKGAVILHNDTAGKADGKYVIADVVRFGGGMGVISRGNGKPPASGKTTHRPAWESCARYHTQYMGAPKSVYDYVSSTSDGSDDVGSRSRFSAWHHEGSDPAIYLSWHSNAPDPGRGTSTYIYGTKGPGQGSPFSGTKGSDTFAKLLQTNLITAIRTAFDPKWKDRGVKTAWFGEVNPKHNPEMPAALIESAFHSTKADADYLRRPRFRYVLSRAMYRSIVQYFAKVDGTKTTLLPEPPTAVRAWHDATKKTLKVSWKAGNSGGIAGDKPTGWVVQTSSDGKAFNAGITLAQAKTMQWQTPVVKLGAPVFFRVLAVNEGGISMPSTVVGVVPGCGASEALVVHGFTRLSANQLPRDDLSPWSLKTIQRLRQWKMNTYDDVIHHLFALAAAGVSADSAQRDTLADLNLGTYALVDWIAGEQSTDDVVWSAADRKQLADWLNGGAGRAMWASGSEIAWAVAHKGGKDAADWLATWFGVGYASDDAKTYKAQVSVAGAGQPLSVELCKGGDNCEMAGYDVDWPDALKLIGAKTLASYVGGDGGVAAAWHKAGSAKTALFGFPVEACTSKKTMTMLTQAVVTQLDVPAAGFVCSGGNGGGADAGGAGTDAGEDAGADPVDSGASTDAGMIADTTTQDGGSEASPDTDNAEDSGSNAGDTAARAEDAGRSRADVAEDAGNWVYLDVESDLATSFVPPPADSGCGCDVRGGGQAPTPWNVGLVLVCLGLVWRRRASV